jgi:hypothetical protein
MLEFKRNMEYCMISPRSSTTTAVWITINLLPLLVAALVWFVFGSWLLGLLLIVLYPLYILPYGFFVSLPLMIRLFRPPASVYRQR